MADNFPLGLGQIITERPANPAAGANLVYTPSPRRIEQPLAIQMTLTTDASVPARTVRYRMLDATGETIRISSSQTQGASVVRLWYYLQGTAMFLDNANNYFAPWPDNLIIPLAGSLNSSLTNFAAADQISDIRIIMATWVRT